MDHPTPYQSVLRARDLLTAHAADSNAHVTNALKMLDQWSVSTTMMTALCLVPLLDVLPGEELTRLFGLDVVRLAERAALLIEQPGRTDRASSAAKLQQLFTYAYHDLPATLISVAIHITTPKRLHKLDEQSRRLWAEQTMQVHLPLLELLGLWAYRDEMSHHGLVVLQPELYDELSAQAFTYYKHYEKTFGRIRNDLFHLLEAGSIHGAEITLYDITQASIYRRMQRAQQHGLKLEDMGRLTIDILVRTREDCYRVLGVIHQQWQPVHNTSNLLDERFSDYIASPKYNGYRSLITTVIHTSELIKFRIRTHEMEEINQYGVLAGYDKPLKNVWWADATLREIIHPEDDQSQNESIYVFTPSGQVIHPLRRGSTVVDVAFKIHSETGPYARQFWVNGQPVNYTHTLQNGDLVEIEYDHKYPSLTREWADHARTGTARSNIKRFLKRQEQSPHRGRDLIDEVLLRETQIYELRFPTERVEQALKKISRKLDYPSPEALYADVSLGKVAPDEIVATMIEDELVGYITLEDGKSRPRVPVQIARSWMQEKTSKKWDKSSRVLPGTEIVGRYTGKGNKARLVVHRKDSPYAPPEEKAVTLRWRSTKDVREAAEIDVLAKPQSYITGMVLKAAYAANNGDDSLNLTVHRFHADLQNRALVINMVVDAPSLDGIRRLQNELNTIQRSGYITEFKIWQLFPGQKMMLAGKMDKRQQNPYTLSKISDRSMFFGREDEITSVIEYLNNDENFVVISGQKRIGKTSLMYQLAENLLGQMCNVLPVPFDAHSIAPFDTVSFFHALAETTHERLRRHLQRSEGLKGLRLRERDLEKNPFVSFAGWVEKVEKRLGGKRLLFVVDEFTTAEEKYQSGQLDETFFDGMQWLAGNRRVGFLLCVHDHVFKQSSRSWTLLQRAQVIRLGSLERDAAALLIQQPLERIYTYESGVVEQILDLTNSHPYFIQIICQEIVKHVSRREDNAHVTQDDLQRAVRVLLLSGDHYFNHLCNRQDEHTFDTLKIIAYICNDYQSWISRDDIRDSLQRYGYDYDGKMVSRSIGELARADVIESQYNSQQAVYRIPIGVFRLWLRQIVTHPIVSRDIRRKD